MEPILPSKMSGPMTVSTALLYGKLLEPTFRISDTDINSKIYHTWRMGGLVDMIVKGKWANFSFVEYLWLQILESMRKMGCSVKLMKAVHKELFKRAYEEDLARKTAQENLNTLINESKRRILTKNEEELLKKYEETLKDELLLSYLRNQITYFYQLVVSCFSNNDEAGLIIFEDQTFCTYNRRSQIEQYRSQPHILIPITYFIKDFIADEEKEKFLVPSGLITDEENKIINLVRDKNVKKLTITFNENNEPIKFETEDSGIIQGEKAKQIKQILGLKNYSAIELKTRDGNTLSYTLGKREF